jgi:AAA domain-containing protein
MPSLADPTTDILYCMFKGEWGTRKSTCALSFPTPQYWFSWDRKMRALHIPMRNWGINPAEIKYDDYDDWSKARVQLEKFQLSCPFKTLIIDSITSCGDSIMRQTRKMKVGETRKSGAEAGIRIAGIQVNELEDYNAESAALHELIALTKDIHKFHKVNIVLIAHVIQTDYKSPDGKTHFARSIVTAAKKASAKMPAYCDEVYHFNIKRGFDASMEGEYALLTTHTGDDYARTTLPLPKEIVFGNKSLYGEYLLPAMNKLTTTPSNQPVTTFEAK